MTLVTVGHLTSVVTKGTTPTTYGRPFVEEGINFVKVESLDKDGSVLFDRLAKIDDETHKLLKRSQLQRGDILFSIAGAIGRLAIVPDALLPANTNQAIAILRPLPDLVDRQFLYYYLRSATFQSYSLGRVVQTAQANVSLSELRGAPVNLPPLSTQRKIAAALSTYDDLIENNSRRIKLLEEMAQRIYCEWFVDFRYPGNEQVSLVASEVGQAPRGWQIARASDVLDINPRIPYDRSLERPFVPMTSVSETMMHLEPIERRTTSSGSRFQNGDTLFARITPCLENGKTGYVQCLAPRTVASGSTEFIVLRAKHVPPEYGYLLARSDPLRRHAIQSMSGATGRQRVRESCFDTYMIPVPPSELAEQFSAIVRPMFALSYSLFCERNNLRASRDLLLPRVISGEIDVADLDIQVAEAA